MANSVQANRGNHDELICQICTKKGHEALTCYNRYNEYRFPSEKSNKYRLKSKNISANAVWYPDSGATDHIVSNGDDIDFKNGKTNDDAVTVANGNS